MRKLCDWLKTPVRVVIGYWCIWVFLIGLDFLFCMCGRYELGEALGL